MRGHDALLISENITCEILPIAVAERTVHCLDVWTFRHGNHSVVPGTTEKGPSIVTAPSGTLQHVSVVKQHIRCPHIDTCWGALEYGGEYVLAAVGRGRRLVELPIAPHGGSDQCRSQSDQCRSVANSTE